MIQTIPVTTKTLLILTNNKDITDHDHKKDIIDPKNNNKNIIDHDHKNNNKDIIDPNKPITTVCS